MDTYIDQFREYHGVDGKQKQLDELDTSKEAITRPAYSMEVIYGAVNDSHRYVTYSMPSGVLFSPVTTPSIPQRNVLNCCVIHCRIHREYANAVY